MAFDEAYHIGLIRVHAQHVSPILTGAQPEYLDEFGAVVRNNSYVYHYLMSWPWRLFTALTDAFAAQVILLRLLNVGLFVSGLVVWRRALLALNPSRMLVNLITALVVLTPVTSLVAAQVNYDNLLFLATGVFVLLVVQVLVGLQKDRFDTPRVLGLLAVGMMASLVKYPFLPIAVAAVVYLGLTTWQQWRRKPQGLRREALRTFGALKRWQRYTLVFLVVVAALLCVERFGVHMVRYGTPVPECDQVLSIERCHAYSPWERNYQFAQEARPDGWRVDAVGYVFFWLRRLVFNLLFVLSGPDGGYVGPAPLLWPKVAFLSLCTMGAACMVLALRRLFRHPVAPLVVAVCVAYVLVLFIQNFSEYVRMGQPVAVQGRYLVPILPLLYFLPLTAIRLQLGRRVRLQKALATVLVMGFLWGGGIMTYFVRTDSSWYWPHPAVQRANKTAQDITRFLVPGDSIQELFRHQSL
jgi:energy-converting hydrogenase Eha subunit C